MLNTLLIDAECGMPELLTQHLSTYCPHVDVSGVAQTPEDAGRLLRATHPDLVFIDMDLIGGIASPIFDSSNNTFETILLHRKEAFHDKAYTPVGTWLSKPIEIRELVMAVHQAEHWLVWKREMRQNRQLLEQISCLCPSNQLIGIPTIDGMEFLKAGEIIRCEGMQRLTKVFTDRGISISSYNIGEFGKLLCPYDFFAPHKSHLFNMQYLYRYCIDGSITLRDGSQIPLARRRKEAFLERVRHL